MFYFQKLSCALWAITFNSYFLRIRYFWKILIQISIGNEPQCHGPFIVEMQAINILESGVPRLQRLRERALPISITVVWVTISLIYFNRYNVASLSARGRLPASLSAGSVYSLQGDVITVRFPRGPRVTSQTIAKIYVKNLHT